MAVGFLVLTLLHLIVCRKPTHAWMMLGVVPITALAFYSNDFLPLKFYPVLVNLTLLTVFGYSLISPPSMVERFARLGESQLSEEAIRYTRRVTQVWCIFFVFNGSVAASTAVWGSDLVWMIYNGCLSYLLMGILFAGEWIWRQRLKKGAAA